MPPTCVTACLARDEASNWLPQLLPIWKSYGSVLVLDDGSTDGTPTLAASHGALVSHRGAEGPSWGSESPARAQLWQEAVGTGATWVFVEDADMLPLRDPTPLFLEGLDAVAFPLYDIWDLPTLSYREDQFWQGHLNHRVWAVRNPSVWFQPVWPDRGIHCGHIPTNIPLKRVLNAPHEFAILHLGYATPEARERKFKQYESQRHQLTEREWEHAKSILDPSPNLKPLPWEPQWPIK